MEFPKDTKNQKGERYIDRKMTSILKIYLLDLPTHS